MPAIKHGRTLMNLIHKIIFKSSLGAAGRICSHNFLGHLRGLTIAAGISSSVKQELDV